MTSHLTTYHRRHAIRLLIIGTAFAANATYAAPPTVEIVAFAHPPVVSALKPLREWLASQSGRLKLVETDLESPAGAQRLLAAGIKGHVPIVILVNGQHQQKRADGSMVELVSFPGPKSWTIEDVKAVITRAGVP
jgi:hypothetical protein